MEDKRFEVVSQEDSGFSYLRAILVDKETGVNYLFVQSGYAGGLTPLLDADGTPRLAYNTCQVCAGSPYAYFAYQQGALVCQNCGNAFDLSSVGQAAGGCNPLPVTDYQTDADTITIPAAALKQASAAFANWKKGLQ